MAAPAAVDADNVFGYFHGLRVRTGCGDTVGQMRIVAGSAGGQHISTPEGESIRPTKDRVREAVFNSLNSYGLVDDHSILDLFAGSGALGLEALSRGASTVTFVDNDRQAVAVITSNLEYLGFADRAVVRQADATTLLGSLAHHDVALLDPPYGFDAWPTLLADVPAATVVVESDRPIELGPRWRILKEKRYAGTFVIIAQRAEGGSEPVQEVDAKP